MVEKFIELKSPIKVQRAWRAQFGSKDAPRLATIIYNAAKFRKTGSVTQAYPKQRTQAKKVTKAKIQLKNLISAKPTLSIRKASCAIGVSYSTTRIILREDLHLKPYKYQDYHELLPLDYPKRVKFAKWILSLPSDAINYFICTDEAYFYLTESVNKQNNRFWLESRPVDWIERPLHDEKVLVWCAISAKKIYGPFFLKAQ